MNRLGSWRSTQTRTQQTAYQRNSQKSSRFGVGGAAVRAGLCLGLWVAGSGEVGRVGRAVGRVVSKDNWQVDMVVDSEIDSAESDSEPVD